MQVYFPGKCPALVIAVMNLQFLLPQFFFVLITNAQTTVGGGSSHKISHAFFSSRTTLVYVVV
jgi:hypothetical protein